MTKLIEEKIIDFFILYIYINILYYVNIKYKRCKKNKATDKFLENMHNNVDDIMHLINQPSLVLKKVGIVFSMPRSP